MQAFQLHLADRLRPLTSPDEMIRVASEALGRMTGVERVLYAEMDDERGTVTIRRDWMGDESASLAGVVRPLSTFGEDVIDSLRDGHIVRIEDINTDPLTARVAATYRSFDIQAVVIIPLRG